MIKNQFKPQKNTSTKTKSENNAKNRQTNIIKKQNNSFIFNNKTNNY